MKRGVNYAWHPVPEEAAVQLVAIERRAVRRHPAALPSEPARVVWGLLIDEGGTNYERHDLDPGVIRALNEDGGERIYPMMKISPLRINAAVERTTGGPRAEDEYTPDLIADAQ